MPKRSLPEIREAVKAITSDLRLRVWDENPAEYKSVLLLLDDIDNAMDETRRADYGKPKPKKADPVMKAIDLG